MRMMVMLRMMMVMVMLLVRGAELQEEVKVGSPSWFIMMTKRRMQCDKYQVVLG